MARGTAGAEGAEGKTKGYKFHSQLDRFKRCKDPVSAIALYLQAIHEESVRRGYSFDKSKIGAVKSKIKIPVRAGQIDYEFEHLKRKLKNRDRNKLKELKVLKEIIVHPLFRQIPGEVENWERMN